MNKMKKLAYAVFAVVGMSGCTSMQVASLASADQAPASVAQKQAVEHKVSRALPSYGSMGGYRYRRFAAVAAAS
jgi:PBP1b-binding outer membrane lipoprotein LpoB